MEVMGTSCRLIRIEARPVKIDGYDRNKAT